MDKIKELVNDIAECFDGHGIPNLDYVEDKVNELKKLVNKTNDIHDVSLSFEAKEKIIDLHGYVTEIEEVDGDVVWFYDQNGEYMSLRKEYVKRYSS